MFRTQIYLTAEERAKLRELSKTVGKSQSELIREAVDQFAYTISDNRRMQVMEKAAGMWGDRDDLPDADELRRTWDRGPSA